MEEWKDIEGYEGMYKISNLGVVKSLDRWVYGRGRKKKQLRHGILMKPKTDRYGYLSIQLIRENNRQHITVHRLVALAFIKNSENKPQVNHIGKDENGKINKKDNRAVSLEWATAKENVDHAYKNGLGGDVSRGKHGMAKLVLDLQTGIYYDCGKDAADAKGLTYSRFRESLLKRRGGINRTGLVYV